jgi:hypothetical protein
MNRVQSLVNGVYKLVANFTLAIGSPSNGQVLSYQDGVWLNKNFQGNFSYKRVPTGVTITIPTDQQMLVKGEIVIEGELIIEGELCLF